MAKSSYTQILKATGIFGGVQVVQVAVAVVKNKCVALLLGPDGVGINGLLTSTVTLVNSIANMGLQSSAVREVAQADGNNNPTQLATIVRVVKRLVGLMGLLALLFVVLASPYLSRWVMGDDSYTIAFIWLSLAVLFEQLSMGQLTLLQGLRQYNYLAKANVIGSLLGLGVSVPLYYYWGVDGIVPAIILSSLFLLLRTWYFTRKIKIERVALSWRETFRQGGDMLKLGFVMALTSFIAVGSTYLVRIYLTHRGGLADVGYYNAAFVIAESYVGMVFSAMSTDYFPRLSVVNNDNKACRQLVNEQGEVSLILLLPLLMVLTTCASLVVRLLYSTAFVAMVPMLQWVAVAILIKAATFSFDYVYIAKGDKRLFLVSEIFSWSCILVASIVGYHYGGLEGLGVGYLVGYLLSLAQTLLLNAWRYSIYAERALVRIALYSFAFVGGNLAAVRCLPAPYSYIASTLLIGIACYLSYSELNRRMDIAALIQKIRDKIA